MQQQPNENGKALTAVERSKCTQETIFYYHFLLLATVVLQSIP
jgi:hypothetical protein